MHITLIGAGFCGSTLAVELLRRRGPDTRVTLVGQPETELVRQLGVPSRTYDAGGRRFIAYSERRTDIYGGGPFFGGFGYFGAGYGLYGAFPAQVVERGCETTFEVGEGRVVSWALRGNACG